MLEALKDSRSVKLLVGLTVVLCIAWTLITGDLPLLTQTAFAPQPPEGSTQEAPGSVLTLVGPMLLQVLVIIGGSVITLFSGLWGWMVRAVEDVKAARSGSAVSSPASIASQSSGSPDSEETITLAAKRLVKAAMEADAVGLEQNRVILRRPVAMKRHQEALAASDLDAADALMAELRSLIGSPTEAASGSESPRVRKGASNNAK